MLIFLLPAPALLVAGIIVFWFGGKRRIGGALIAVGALTTAAALYVQVAYKPYRLPSESMVPTLEVNERILVRKGQDAEVGDIVVFHPPVGAATFDGTQCGVPVSDEELCPRPAGGTSDINFIKRVVAVGGDRIRLRDGKVVRNGEEQDEPYVAPCEQPVACNYQAEITVPDDHVYLLGDNRGQSDDSRFWGPVPEDAIVGKAVYRYWPSDRVGGL